MQSRHQTEPTFILSGNTDLMDRPTAEREARRFALHHGSAVEALARCNTRDGANEFTWALRSLANMERGEGIKEQEEIFAMVTTEAGRAIIGERLASAKKRQADWLRELTVAKASRFMSSAQVAA